MMPSPSIHDRSDARHSCWLSAGSAPACVGPPDRPAVTPQIFWRNVRSACSPRHARPRFKEKRSDRRLASTSSTLTPRPNPHSARGTVGAPHPAISCLGAFRTPAAAARGWSRHSGVRKPAQQRTLPSHAVGMGENVPRHKVAALQPAARGQEPRGRSQLRGQR